MPAKNKGFTLVELSIVMIIIGLLIGGILKGQQLIENARINSTLSQIKAFQAATNTFRDSYGGIPGDLSNATTTIPDCVTATYCQNGNSDFKLGSPIEYYTDASTQAEGTQFWKHLALANLISGIEPGSNPAMPEWGKSHPESSLLGGFLVLNTQAVGDLYRMGASAPYLNWIKLRQNISGNDAGFAGGHPITPTVAKIIDTRIDDGEPGSGMVQAHDIGPGADAGCEGLVPYNESFTSGNCIMFFRLDTR